jgi:hypothetical protein
VIYPLRGECYICLVSLIACLVSLAYLHVSRHNHVFGEFNVRRIVGFNHMYYSEVTPCVEFECAFDEFNHVSW